MTVGEVIKKHRKERGFTQEEVAKRLGVTTPAVNKWENNNTLPDISLLAPIARLFGISTDTLLSYQEGLSKLEVDAFIRQLHHTLEKEGFAAAFSLAEEKILEYPASEDLIWQATGVLDAWRLMRQIEDSESYDDAICHWYTRVLQSENLSMRRLAANSLYHFYFKKEQYEKAEEYLSYFPEGGWEKQSHLADIYQKTGRQKEAYVIYENFLLSGYYRLDFILNSLAGFYLKAGDYEMTRKLTGMQSGLAELFDMGAYRQHAPFIDVAVHEKDVEKTERLMRRLIENIHSLTAFIQSPLYAHLPQKPVEPAFVERVKADLIRSFTDEEDFAYMRGNAYWESLKKYRSKLPCGRKEIKNGSSNR